MYNSLKSLKNCSFTVGLCNGIGYMFALTYLPQEYMETVFVKQNRLVTPNNLQ